CLPPSEPLQVVDINMKKAFNEGNHFTNEYMTNLLVVRRGQQFVIDVSCNRPLQWRLTAFPPPTGSDPTPNKDSMVVVTFGNRSGGSWGGQILGSQGAVVSLGITPHPRAIVGLYRTYVAVSTGNGMQRTEKNPNTNLYVLFNPWSQDDEVFYPDDAGRWEYVLNSTGIIYQGTSNQVSERGWVFGQFEAGVLDACIYILDVCRMPIESRGDVIKVLRTASAMINSQDDNGVLVGNWGEDFSMGVAPTTWTGSAKILLQYHNTGAPVSFAQCWVYAGVLNTFMRCLGIPARVITNFNSAHDNTGNLKTELIFMADGSPDRRRTRDSIWNYHCWNEAYIKRVDLPPKYSGWQVVDATPQETSDGFFRCGPAPVIAVKDGELYHPFDCGFVFAEVNSDLVHMKSDKYGNLSPFKVDTTYVGILIYTKAMGGWSPENVTHTYKYPEGNPNGAFLCLQLSGRPQVNQEMYVTVSFKNSLQMTLYNAKLVIEGAGLLDTIGPFAEISQKVKFSPQKPGLRTIVAVLDSQNLPEVTIPLFEQIHSIISLNDRFTDESSLKNKSPAFILTFRSFICLFVCLQVTAMVEVKIMP
uniref:Coagulation factor XIII A chain-like n=1 Tax=Kryptolebias marmoratus TaxID=37003 RepID=A0A3Q3GB79_KRYMA